ncbi:hypothetical protein PtA15_13A508 [Puccinia triticina]|uniref:PAC domain-containing protein n=1 Tax=Puccinia triticina TaxID=208348 RepID=A0ABY7D888_9BASI|nr:uncharacterized protein PtA15_13A508 [Puccinia triticina]WAQ91107.1 hypothetical protein PtA15_13A508 [Puccinia triticina]
MSRHQPPMDRSNTPGRQFTTAIPPAQGLTKSQSNKSSHGEIPTHRKAECQDPHIRTASTSSEVASSHSSMLQKTLRITRGDYPTVCSLVSSLISIPVTSSDFDTDSDDGSSMEHGVPHVPRTPSEPTGRVEFPNQPLRIFNSSDDRMERSLTVLQAMNLGNSTSTEVIVPADAPLETMYGKELTSYPHKTAIEEEMKASLLSLLSLESFTYMLSKPETRNVFREWLIVQGGEEKLDRWTEESRINQLHIEAQQSAKHLLHNYHEYGGKDGTRTNGIDMLNGNAIRETINLAHSTQVLVASRQHLLESLYNDTFKQFITSKLLEITKMKLRSGVDEKACKGLGDSFVVSNPRLRDNPVVMVSPSFSATTGHEKNSIIGMNCRFLQGPGTSPQSIQRLRQALKQGLPCVELLLNYKADGTPFYCLLSIIPLFDDRGYLSYYIGGQINVTDELRNNQIMALISQTNSAPKEITSADFQLPARTLARQATSKKVAIIYPRLLNKQDGNIDSRASNVTLNVKTKPPRTLSFNWLRSKIKQDKNIEDVEFTKPDDRCEFKSSDLHESLSAFRSTYSRLILFNKITRSIVYVTPEALKFLGFPTETIEETYSSALLHHDFFDLVENCKTTRKTPTSKKVLKKIISKDASASFQCELCWSYTLDDQHTRIILKQRKKVEVNETSVVHLTPLIDQTGNCASYVAILT